MLALSWGVVFPSGSVFIIMLSSIARAVGLVLLLVYLQMMAIPSPGYGFGELSGGDKDVTGELTRTSNGRFARMTNETGPIKCLHCNIAIPANCTVNNVNRTISCKTDATVCPKVNCNVNSENQPTFCQHTFKREMGLWEFSTACFVEEEKEKCEFKKVVRFNKTFPPVEGFRCQCNDIENCTLEEPILYVHRPRPKVDVPVIVPQPPIVVASTVTTSSSLSPPVTPSPNMSGGGSPLHEKVAIILLPIIATIVIVMLVIVSGVCLKRGRKTGSSRPRSTSRRPGANGTVLHNVSREHDLPFQLGHLVSRGRFSCVYRTEYEGELVAVKIFLSQNYQYWENESTLFSMQSTKHRNVIDFVGSMSWGSGYQRQMYIMTRFLPLGSLNKFLERNTVSWEQACRVIHSVSSGLGHLHGESYTNSDGVLVGKYAVAHRDVKSANVLVRGENGDCVIADLGFAMILDPSKDAKDAGQVGTFRYMAPEVLDARVNLHNLHAFTQIDIYALALVMWEVVWRCNVLEDVSPQDYMMAYEDSVGPRPGIDSMRDIVCTQKLRPQILPAWSNHTGLGSLVEAIEDCWDEDPEARLSASNITFRLKELLDGGPPTLTEDHTPFNHVPIRPGNERYRRRGEAQETTTDTIGTTDSRPPPYDSRWSYANAGGGDERVNGGNSLGLIFNETTI